MTKPDWNFPIFIIRKKKKTRNEAEFFLPLHITEPRTSYIALEIPFIYFFAYVIKRLIGCIFGVQNSTIQSLFDCQFKMFIFRFCNALIVIAFSFIIHISFSAELLPLFTYINRISESSSSTNCISNVNRFIAYLCRFILLFIFLFCFSSFCSFVTTLLFHELIEILNLHYLRTQNK